MKKIRYLIKNSGFLIALLHHQVEVRPRDTSALRLSKLIDEMSHLITYIIRIRCRTRFRLDPRRRCFASAPFYIRIR